MNKKVVLGKGKKSTAHKSSQAHKSLHHLKSHITGRKSTKHKLTASKPVKHVISKHTVHKPKAAHKFYSKKFCPNCGNPIIDNNTLCKNCRGTDFDFKEIIKTSILYSESLDLIYRK